MNAKTYDLKELSKLLNFTPAYCKMVLKGWGVDPNGAIDEPTAAKLAEKLSRPWPPQ
ncbi:MAG: hypothetical protein R3A47_09465 [Polyangiales bacterium]